MLDLNTAATYWLLSEPADMRKSKNTLASLVRETTGKDPICGSNAFIFYAKNLKTVKILHHDFTGYELYIKWFDDGKFLKPVFNTISKTHVITKSQLLLFLTGAVQTKLNIE
ncbi:MAG: IS66 family insertion sequence element accessory protein TnpB [Lachnospiraceae bacterium]|nr:IS66 family insertion sequence element accessory protein TnpB [Lachnospiraceae bacterium]MCM1441896.1 IS66 family insertion sequence element accessory protein TnpB [Roseburia sp.]